MSCVSKEKYASYLERLVSVTHSQPVDRDAYVQLITEICKDYKLTKGMSEFYITPMMEQRGLGEVFCDFDNGKSTKVLLRIRIISTSKAVVFVFVPAKIEFPSDDTAFAF